MRRRVFIKNVALGIGVVSFFDNTLFAKENSRKFKVIYDFELKNEEKSFPAQLWNPLPLDINYQKVKFLKFNGNYDNSNINTNNPYDAKILYAKWNKSNTKKTLHLEMEIETTYRSVSLKVIQKASEANLPLPKDVSQFLETTAHIPTTGRVKEIADRLIKSETDAFSKVQALYDWVTETTFRDPKVKGCGLGDVNQMLKNGYFGGKCTDISSLFVALLRAANIPAREVFGIRLGSSDFSKALGTSDENGFANISSWQHCKVEYFIAGAGWIPSDPADITKLEFVEDLKYSDKRVQELKAKFLHSWEMNWMGFNWGRDFVLYPQPEQFPINMLGYPYGESDGNVLNYYSPKDFSYKITSKEIK